MNFSVCAYGVFDESMDDFMLAKSSCYIVYIFIHFSKPIANLKNASTI